MVVLHTIIGQFYLAVVMAYMLSIYIAQREPQAAPKNEDSVGLNGAERPDR